MRNSNEGVKEFTYIFFFFFYFSKEGTVTANPKGISENVGSGRSQGINALQKLEEFRKFCESGSFLSFPC